MALKDWFKKPPPRPTPSMAQPPRPPLASPSRPVTAVPSPAASNFGASAARRAPSPTTPSSPPRMPAPLRPFELPSSLTTERGGIRMSLGEHSTPTEFLGEANDDPLIPLNAAECTSTLNGLTRGGVDGEAMLAVVIDVEVRTELSARYNVALIDHRGELVPDLVYTLVGMARRRLGDLGMDANAIEEAKREYAEPFERELRRRLGR